MTIRPPDKNVIGLSVLYAKFFGATYGKLQTDLVDRIQSLIVKPKKEDELFPNYDTNGYTGFDLSAFDSTTFNGVQLFAPVKIGDLQLPNEPLISFSKRNEIVSTQLTGTRRAGSVKEIIGQTDWQIEIKGIAIYPFNPIRYPREEVRAIRELFDRTAIEGSLSITNPICELLNITSVVITDVSFPQMEGVQHAQAYTMKLISDEDFVLTKIDNNTSNNSA